MGGDVFIVDDPLKPDDATSAVKRTAANRWFGGTPLSRLDNKEKGIIILAMQRSHLSDLTGYLIRETTGCDHLELSAIAVTPQQVLIGRERYYHRKVGEVLNPAFESEAVLNQLREAMGSVQFSAQYQQRPVPLEGALTTPTGSNTTTVSPNPMIDPSSFKVGIRPQRRGSRIPIASAQRGCFTRTAITSLICVE